MKTSIVRAGVLATALLGVAGCSDGGSGSAGTASSAAGTSTAAATATVVVAAAAPVIPEAEVKKVVGTWLDSQNSGNLTAYLALYADRFEGVRRSGERTARMDRKGWAKARTQLFAKKMVVSAEDVVITSTDTTAQVTFTQTWASGSYKDTGPKLMVLVRDRSGLHIAREEMLASTLLGVTRLPALSPERFAFVLQDGGTHVVLKESPPPGWAEGAPTLLANKDPYPTKVAVSASRLPPDLAAWSGKKMRLYGAAGQVCEATLGALSLLGRVTPHFGEVAHWNGTGEPAGPAFSSAQKARAAFNLAATASPNGLVLVADLAGAKGDCKQALWAQPESAAVVKMARAEPADAVLTRSALEALRALPDYAEIQKTNDVKGPWDERGKPEVSRMKHPSGKTLVMISVDAVQGCADFQGSLAAVFELTGTRLQLAGKPTSFTRAPAAAMDADGDGKLEILFSEHLLRGEAGYDQLDGLTIPFLDCGC